MEPQTTDLDTTLATFNNGITAIAPGTAARLIDGWQGELASSDRPELQQIANELAELKRLLTGGTLDGRAIGQTLTRLGSQTTAAAANADGAKQSKLQQLGQALARAGKALS